VPLLLLLLPPLLLLQERYRIQHLTVAVPAPLLEMGAAIAAATIWSRLQDWQLPRAAAAAAALPSPTHLQVACQAKHSLQLLVWLQLQQVQPLSADP
jgi:hypothetical protein